MKIPLHQAEPAKQPGQAKQFTLRLSLTGIVVSVFIVIFSLLWFFIMGVLVGRGYQPEEAASQLTTLLPSPAEKQPDTLPEALRPEELEFDKNLMQKTDNSSEKTPPSSPAPAAAKAATGSLPTGQTTHPPSATLLSPAEEIPQGQIYTYVYQCASFRDNAIARAFQIELDDHNLQSSLEQIETETGVWYRILVTFTGTQDQTEKVKQILAELGINKPLLKKKTPL